MIRYRSRRAPDTSLRDRLRELASERRRFGYRCLLVLLRREGELSGINRVYRLYREEGLTVRKQKARRKAIAHTGANANQSASQREMIIENLQVENAEILPERQPVGMI